MIVFERCLCWLEECVRTLLFCAGGENIPGPAPKCHCCSKRLGKSIKKNPTIKCHVGGWVHSKSSGLRSLNDYEKSQNCTHFRCTCCAKNTKVVASADPSFLRLPKIDTRPNKKAAFGSRQALIKAAPKGTTCKQLDKILSQSETYTKFRASRNKFWRLKVQAYHIKENLSCDLADVHQLARQIDGTKLLLVSVDCLSRFLRAEPIKSKSASQTKCALQKMLKKSTRKNWAGQG